MEVFNYVISLFTTRELAIGFWIIVIFLFIQLHKSVRKSLFEFIKTLFSKPLRMIIVLMIIYFLLVTFCFTKFYFWKGIYFKDAILWLLFNGVFFVFNVLDKSSNEKYIRNYLRSNFGIFVCISYLVDSFTFSFLFELVMIPLIVLLTCVECFFNNDSKNEDVHVFIIMLEAFLFIVFIVCTIIKGTQEYSQLLNIDLIIEFLIAPAYIISFTPFVFVLDICAVYDRIFFRLSIKDIQNKDLLRKHKFEIMKICQFSKKRLKLFEKDYLFRFYNTISETEIDKIFNDFKGNL